MCSSVIRKPPVAAAEPVSRSRRIRRFRRFSRLTIPLASDTRGGPGALDHPHRKLLEASLQDSAGAHGGGTAADASAQTLPDRCDSRKRVEQAWQLYGATRRTTAVFHIGPSPISAPHPSVECQHFLGDAVVGAWRAAGAFGVRLAATDGDVGTPHRGERALSDRAVTRR